MSVSPGTRRRGLPIFGSGRHQKSSTSNVKFTTDGELRRDSDNNFMDGGMMQFTETVPMPAGYKEKLAGLEDELRSR